MNRMLLGWAAAAAAGLTLLAGCSTQPSESPATGAKVAPSLTALFQQTRDERKDTLSDFEKEVLDRAIATGKIAAADYQEAVSRRTQCMVDAGYTESLETQPNGLIKIVPTVPSEGDLNAWNETYFDKSMACAEGNLKVIEMLYRDQQGNPDLLSDPMDIIMNCLQSEGVPTEGFTAADLAKWVENPKSVKLPFSLTDPLVKQCMSNGGVAIETTDGQVG